MEEKKKEKEYSPEEVARTILAKAHDMLKNSTLFKANTSHEIELGEEPRNDDAEAPEYLANADIENSDSGSTDSQSSDSGESFGKKKKKKTNIDGEESEEESMEDMGDESMEDDSEYEEDMGAEESEDDSEYEEEDEEEKPFYKKSEDEMTDVEKAAYDMEDGKQIQDKEARKRNDISDGAAAKYGRNNENYRRENKQKIKTYKRRSTAAKKSAASRTAKKRKMAKSEGQASQDGIEKVYNFLAKSYAKKCERPSNMTDEELKVIGDVDAKTDKKKKLKKMMGAQGPKDPQGVKPPQEQMKPQTGATGMKGY
jgi:hypothetical protein